MKLLNVFIMAFLLGGCANPLKLETTEYTKLEKQETKVLQLKFNKDRTRYLGQALRKGTHWVRVGTMAQGNVYRGVEQPAYVSGRKSYESYLVVDEGSKVVGFYIPTRHAYVSAHEPDFINFKTVEKVNEMLGRVKPLHDVPAISNGKGRLYFYRTTLVDFMLHPMIRINGKTLGRSDSAMFTYIDLEPGTYSISTGKDEDCSLEVVLEEGAERFVGLDSTVGSVIGRFYPILSNHDDSWKKMNRMKFSKAQFKEQM